LKLQKLAVSTSAKPVVVAAEVAVNNASISEALLPLAENGR